MAAPFGPLLFANNATSSLAAGIGPGATTIVLQPGTGALFPQPSTGQSFLGTLTDKATGLVHEIVLVTAVTGDNLTVVRAQEGTSAASWLTGDLFANVPTAGTMAQLAQLVGVPWAEGNCRLKLSGGSLVLSPYKGNRVPVAGVVCTLSSPVPLAATGLQVPVAGSSYSITSNIVTYNTSVAHGLIVGGTVNIFGSVQVNLNGNFVVLSTPSNTQFTFALTNTNVALTTDINSIVRPIYYLYAGASGGVINSMIPSQLGHMVDPVTGIECQNSTPASTPTPNNALTLVGMTVINASNQFQISSSWFYREAQTATAVISVVSTSSPTPGELSPTSNARAPFLLWTGEAAQIIIMMNASNNTTGSGAEALVGVDGAIVSSAQGQMTSSVTNQSQFTGATVNYSGSEGLHQAQMFGSALVGGTALYSGAVTVYGRG